MTKKSLGVLVLSLSLLVFGLAVADAGVEAGGYGKKSGGATYDFLHGFRVWPTFRPMAAT
ncbi:MAG: hypothetical protein V3V59_04540 [Thermodesulfovibrionales bacterium]